MYNKTLIILGELPMKMNLVTTLILSSLLSFAAMAQESKVIAVWNGTVTAGNRPCEVRLHSVSEDKADLEVSMTLLFHGEVVIKNFRFAEASKTHFAPSGLNDGIFHTVFSGEAKGPKLTSAFFHGVEGNELRDLVRVGVSVPHGSHAHNYICNF